MSSRLPVPLRELVAQLGKLPGLGPKSAMRIAMQLLKWPENDTRSLGASISSLRDNLCICELCGGLAAATPCPVCADPQRSVDVICIVPEWDSMLALEEGAFYHGQYLVLGGLIDPMDRRDSQSLDLERLERRLAQGVIAEVILALGSTLAAENTASFIRQMLAKKYPQLRVSRLAQGLPLGAEVKFMDKETLRQSLKYRQSL